MAMHEDAGCRGICVHGGTEEQTQSQRHTGVSTNTQESLTHIISSPHLLIYVILGCSVLQSGYVLGTPVIQQGQSHAGPCRPSEIEYWMNCSSRS